MVSSNRLVVVSGAQRGHEHSLGDDQTLGRLASNDVAIDEAGLSREHARVFREDGSWWVEDLGSSNGTFVNGERIQREELHNEDELRLGDIELVFLSDEVPAPAARSAPASRPAEAAPLGSQPGRGGPQVEIASSSQAKGSGARATGAERPVLRAKTQGALGGGTWFGQDLAQADLGTKLAVLAAVVAGCILLFWVIQKVLVG